jgi:Gas vesicle synthesis protein GvpL/GvpF
VIELYAITADPGPPLPQLAPLRAVPAGGGLAAICAPAEDREITPDALWRHEQVVEALMEDRDLLPVRFGTRLEDDAAAARSVAERRVELELALERVRGAVELSVRAVLAEPGPECAEDIGGGADYLRAKRRATVAQDAAAGAVHEPLAALARAHVRRPPRLPAETLRAAYLVDRASVGGFTRLVARLDERHPELRLLCTGPWPPYSFAER